LGNVHWAAAEFPVRRIGEIAGVKLEVRRIGRVGLVEVLRIESAAEVAIGIHIGVDNIPSRILVIRIDPQRPAGVVTESPTQGPSTYEPVQDLAGTGGVGTPGSASFADKQARCWFCVGAIALIV